MEINFYGLKLFYHKLEIFNNIIFKNNATTISCNLRKWHFYELLMKGDIFKI